MSQPHKTHMLVSTINKFSFGLSMFAIVLMGVLITFEVISRYVFGASTLMADEMSAYLLALLIFMGLGHSFNEGGFLKVEILTRRLSETNRRRLEIIATLLALLYILILSYESWLFVWESYDMKYRSVKPSNIMLWIPHLFMPIGSSFFFLQLCSHLCRLFTQKKESN